MGAIAQVTNGELVQNTTSTTSTSSGSTLDKDAFLQLLVAQMKYQDPLEPTSNTEYISQLATFSELEEMQNLTSNMTLQRASSLVGQYVFMKVTDSSGNTTYPEGYVDYVVYENGKAYLSIDDTLYSIDDLDTVADATYVQAGKVAEAFVTQMNKLPAPAKVTEDNLEDIGDLITVYENMTSYQQEFLGKENTALYEKYVERFEELAVVPVRDFINNVADFPSADEITSEDMEALEKLMAQYDSLGSYKQQLINDDSLAAYNTLVEKYNALKAENKTEDTTGTPEESDNENVESGETDKTE